MRLPAKEQKLNISTDPLKRVERTPIYEKYNPPQTNFYESDFMDLVDSLNQWKNIHPKFDTFKWFLLNRWSRSIFLGNLTWLLRFSFFLSFHGLVSRCIIVDIWLLWLVFSFFYPVDPVYDDFLKIFLSREMIHSEIVY